MGVVYLGRDPFIDRMVALKTTLVPPPTDPLKFDEFQQLFFNEARAAGKLMHRNIVSVYDAAVDLDQSYLVMEYVEGDSLNDYSRKDHLLPVNKVINAIFQCAKALDYAHENGVIHRDIKPRNILLSKDGKPKISDFGIAAVRSHRGTDGQARVTGSVNYASPEQLRHDPLTPQSDIFSLGVVLYELLTGEKPFQADTDVATVYKITYEEPKGLKYYRNDIPESLDRIVSKCLSKDLKKRFKTGQALAQALIASFDHLRFLKDEVNQEEKLTVLKKVPFFKDFSASELTEVIRATQWVKHDSATTIIAEGDVEDCFYILISGEVLVRKKGKVLAKLKSGDCFGEMAYLGKTTRTASIVAATNTILMKMRASFIDQTSLSTQLRFYKVFSQTVIERLARTSELLSKWVM
jgi:serine/threonine protein kinase